jgi:hypothetical protein
MDADRFTTAAAVVALLGCPLAAVAPFTLNAAPGPRGGIAFSGLVGAVFAGYNLYAIVTEGRPQFAAAVMATAFGTWLILAPLQYTVAAPLTATTQFAGMLLAAFSGFTALEVLGVGQSAEAAANAGE